MNRLPREFIMGTTSNGQDVFWMLTFAMRNTLLVAGIAVLIGRSIGVFLGMTSGYLGEGQTEPFLRWSTALLSFRVFRWSFSSRPFCVVR